MWASAHDTLAAMRAQLYQATTALKVTMGLPACPNGDLPDPTSTWGKDPAKAKAIEARGWDYLHRLAGRAGSFVVRGDAVGVQTLDRFQFQVPTLSTDSNPSLSSRPRHHLGNSSDGPARPVALANWNYDSVDAEYTHTLCNNSRLHRGVPKDFHQRGSVCDGIL